MARTHAVAWVAADSPPASGAPIACQRLAALSAQQHKLLLTAMRCQPRLQARVLGWTMILQTARCADLHHWRLAAPSKAMLVVVPAVFAACWAPVVAPALHQAFASANSWLWIELSFKMATHLCHFTLSLFLLVDPSSPSALSRKCRSVTTGALTGTLNICTVEGVSTGTALSSFPIQNASVPTGRCTKPSDCGIGMLCSYDDASTPLSSTCICDPATGRDVCMPLGVCVAPPCTKCQNCLTAAGASVAEERNLTEPSKTAVCQDLAALTFASSGQCTAITTKYITPSGSPGFIGLRAGALCSLVGQCEALPASCTLTALVGSVNVTGTLDLCTAEGIQGGTPVMPGVCSRVTVT